MQKGKIIAAISVISICCFLMTGCKEVQIFKDKEAFGKLVPVKNSELEQDTYYIKNGTDFYKTVPTAGSGANTFLQNGEPQLLDKSYVLYAVYPNDQLIPPHYEGEVVAFTSESGATQDTVLERYKDMRYSIGFINAQYIPEEQAFLMDLNDNVIYDTDFYKQVSKLESKEIKVTKIDGEPMTDKNSSAESGMITGLDKNSKHTVELYSGTYFHSIEVTADTQVFQYFETFLYNSGYLSDTENGYRVFNTPTDLKSGYYAINGKGLFKYIAAKRGEIDEDSIYWNEQYYDDDNYNIQLFSQNFAVTLNKHLEQTSITAEVQPTDDRVPAGYVFSPDGTMYQMEYNESNKELRLNLTEALAGKWKICISPKDMNVVSVDVEDNSDIQDLTQENYSMVLSEARENAWFKIPVEPKGNVEDISSIIVTGSIIAPDGATYTLELKKRQENNETKYYMEFNMPYAAPGKYEININHYPERTDIGEPSVEEWDDYQTDTIYVEG